MSANSINAITLISFVLGVVVASFGEYWTHRLMHLRKLLAERHRMHHKRNSAQGVLGEYTDYLMGGVPGLLVFAVPAGWLLSSLVVPAVFVFGGISYGLFAAYSHQLQHENPARCFWMPMPVHYVHHKYNMWHHNFGIGIDLWDRVFGTYKVVEWLGEEERALAARGYLEIKWV